MTVLPDAREFLQKLPPMSAKSDTMLSRLRDILSGLEGFFERDTETLKRIYEGLIF